MVPISVKLIGVLTAMIGVAKLGVGRGVNSNVMGDGAGMGVNSSGSGTASRLRVGILVGTPNSGASKSMGTSVPVAGGVPVGVAVAVGVGVQLTFSHTQSDWARTKPGKNRTKDTRTQKKLTKNIIFLIIS